MRRNDVTLHDALNNAQKTFPVPAKYKYILIMPTELFVKLWSTETIDFEFYNIDNIINYQERNGVMTLSFTTMKACNHVHINTLEFVLNDVCQRVPVIRTGVIKK